MSKKRMVEFVCMDGGCLGEGQSPCVITVWADDHEPDYPNYCPWEFEPASHKYKPWKKVKG